MENDTQKKKKFSNPQLDVIEELTAKLIKANDRLNTVEKERTMMLENISHDLRAPLTAIRSCTDYLKNMCDDYEKNNSAVSVEELKKITHLLDARTKNMEVLVKDLYYLTCLDNGKDDMHFENVPLAQFLEEYFYAVEIDEKYSRRKLQLEVDDNMECIVKIDVGCMTRVFDNLFTNARKYSYDGDSIVLGAYIASDDELKEFTLSMDRYVVIYVRDTGIGIEEKYLKKIFDRTFMISDARTPSDSNGSGLGLAIVDSIVKRHNGCIICTSKVGVGSCFKIYLKEI